MCIFMFSLNFEHNLEDYVWDCKFILMHAWLHFLMPQDMPQVKWLFGDRQAPCTHYWTRNPRSEK